MASTDAKAKAYWGVAHRIEFPIFDADGDLVTGASTPDSEVSKDAGAFADCTNEATEIATNSGMYYLDLTATEMEADCVAVIVKTATAGAKTTPIILYTDRGIRSRKAQAGAAGSITLDSSAVATDDYYNGCLVEIVGGTGVGQSRIISDYVGSTKVASVGSNWATNPDNTSIFRIDALPGVIAANTPTNFSTWGDVGAKIDAVDDLVDTEVAAIKTVVDAILVDTGTTLDAKIDAIDDLVDTEVAAIKTVVDAVKVQTDKLTFTVANVLDANTLRINGVAGAAANLAKTTAVIGRGTASGTPSTTSIPTSAFSPAGVAADQFKGRIITFDADTTTTALRGQSTDITASSADATPTFTVTALTTAPVSGDTFSVT